MARVEHYFTRFEEGEFYHVYNRSIDKKTLFKSDRNSDFFLKRFEFFLSEVVSVYAFCLVENHFHFLIKVCDLKAYREEKCINIEISTHSIVSKQFRRLFQSYALAFNKEHLRCGTLFQTPFKRARVKDRQYLIQLIYYIHYNPQKHRLIEDFRNWKWSSYNLIMAPISNNIHEEIISWFGNKEGYINFHNLRLTNFDNL